MDRDAVNFDANDDADALDLAVIAQIIVDADEMTEAELLLEAAESAPAAGDPAAFAAELGSAPAAAGAPAPAGIKRRRRGARSGTVPISASAMYSIFDSAKGRKTDKEMSKAVWRLTAANTRSALKNKGKRNGFQISLHPAALQFAIRLRLRCGLVCYNDIADVFFLPSSRSLDKVINAGDALESGVMKTVLKDLGAEFGAPVRAPPAGSSGGAGGVEWKHCVTLLFDAMKLSKKVMYNAATNKLVGFTHLSAARDVLLSEFTRAAQALGARADSDPPPAETPLAEQMLVFYVVGMGVSGIHHPVARYILSTVDKAAVRCYFDEVVIALYSVGLVVVSAVDDGAGENRSFMSGLANLPVSQN